MMHGQKHRRDLLESFPTFSIDDAKFQTESNVGDDEERFLYADVTSQISSVYGLGLIGKGGAVDYMQLRLNYSTRQIITSQIITSGKLGTYCLEATAS